MYTHVYMYIHRCMCTCKKKKLSYCYNELCVIKNNCVLAIFSHIIYRKYLEHKSDDILSINISDIVPWSFDWMTLTPRQQG